MDYPRMFRLNQRFDAPVVKDVAGEVKNQMEAINVGSQVKGGQSVAITAGSRGIANIDVIIRTMVDVFKSLGAEPFIVPAMGSHGGGTAEGQSEILRSYGISEETMGCPLKSSMEVIKVGTVEEDYLSIPIYLDKYASEADHIVVANRVKPHTDFVGEIESGMMKMMMIGMGKHEGAKIYHRAIVNFSFDRIVRTVGRFMLSNCPILCGMATLENGYDQTAVIRAVEPENIEEEEKALLKQAKEWLAKLPFDPVDLLIVDEMGKNISGTGMDTNVIGRKHVAMNLTLEDVGGPKVTRIFVRDLTNEAKGNASGIGFADFTTHSLTDKIKFKDTYINCITAVNPKAGYVPIAMDTDREVLDAALSTIGLIEPEDAKVLRVKNTLMLKEVDASEAYLDQMEGRDDLQMVTDAKEMAFDSDGNLGVF